MSEMPEDIKRTAQKVYSEGVSKGYDHGMFLDVVSLLEKAILRERQRSIAENAALWEALTPFAFLKSEVNFDRYDDENEVRIQISPAHSATVAVYIEDFKRARRVLTGNRIATGNHPDAGQKDAKNPRAIIDPQKEAFFAGWEALAKALDHMPGYPGDEYREWVETQSSRVHPRERKENSSFVPVPEKGTNVPAETGHPPHDAHSQEPSAEGSAPETAS